MKIHRLMVPITIVIGVLMAVTLIAAGYLIHRPATVVRMVSVTHTVPAPPKILYVTKWKTKTNTVTVSSPSSPGTYDCYHSNGAWVPTVGGAGGTIYRCTVTFSHMPGAPDSAGPAMFWTGPDGTTTDYSMDFAN